MSLTEDVEKIAAAFETIEVMEERYVHKLLEFGEDAVRRFPDRLHSFRYLAVRSSVSDFTLSYADSENIVFKDWENDEFYLPVAWLEDPDAWAVAAAAEEAAYRKKENITQQEVRDKRIKELNRELARLQAQS